MKLSVYTADEAKRSWIQPNYPQEVTKADDYHEFKLTVDLADYTSEGLLIEEYFYVEIQSCVVK